MKGGLWLWLMAVITLSKWKEGDTRGHRRPTRDQQSTRFPPILLGTKVRRRKKKKLKRTRKKQRVVVSIWCTGLSFNTLIQMVMTSLRLPFNRLSIPGGKIGEERENLRSLLQAQSKKISLCAGNVRKVIWVRWQCWQINFRSSLSRYSTF